METRQIKVYKFKELPEEAQQKVLDKFRNINVDYEWWDFTYDDAKNIGLKITAFDLDRFECFGEFLDSPEECAQKILTKEKRS